MRFSQRESLIPALGRRGGPTLLATLFTHNGPPVSAVLGQIASQFLGVFAYSQIEVVPAGEIKVVPAGGIEIPTRPAKK